MCDHCEMNAAEMLANPEKLERFLRGMTNDAMFLGLAMTHAGLHAAGERQLGAHTGSFALYAVASVLAERFKGTFLPKTAEVVERLRAEVAGRLLLVAVPGPPGPTQAVSAPLSRETH
jgi:hypothetical protein